MHKPARQTRIIGIYQRGRATTSVKATFGLENTPMIRLISLRGAGALASG
jgi:hypothetical protein